MFHSVSNFISQNYLEVGVTFTCGVFLVLLINIINSAGE